MPLPEQPLDNSKQIQQMIGFIKAEAYEKVQEIDQKAAAEYERRFQELKRDKEQQVQAEYKAKRHNANVQRLIQSSHKKQEAKSSLIQLRSNLVDSLKLTVIKKLQGIEKNEQYGQLVLNLIVQGLISVQEEKVVIRCRKIDEAIVQKVLVQAAEVFKKAVADSTGYTPTLQPLTIDTANYLPGPYEEGAVEYCLGGVEVVARGGKIICNNTLDARLELVSRHLLPQIRAFLFGDVQMKPNSCELPHHLTTF
eukprot:UN01671